MKRWKDIAERTVATFAQAFLADVILGNGSVDALKVALIAGGLAAAKFVVKQLNGYLKSEDVA